MAAPNFLVGRITRIAPQYAFMESLPGQSDVYIPKSVLDVQMQPLAEGFSVVVEAVPQNQGHNRWRVTRIVQVLASHGQSNAASTSPRPTFVATQPQRASHESSFDKPVIEHLVQLVVQHGGTMGAQKLSLLYQSHPQAQYEIQATGGLKEYCFKHKSRIRFIPDLGPGQIELAPVVETLAGMLEEQGGQMLGSQVSAVYRLHPRAHEQIRAAGGLKEFRAMHNDRLHFVGGGQPGKTTVQLIQRREVDSGGARRVVGMDSSSPQSTSFKSTSVVDYVVQLVNNNIGELCSEALFLQASVHPGAQSEILAAGGLQGFCSRHHSRIRFSPDLGSGKVTLAPVVDTLVGLLEEQGGQMEGAKVSLLYRLHPQAQEQIRAAGGLREFCSGHRDRLHFVGGGQPGKTMIQLIRGGRLPSGASPAIAVPAGSFAGPQSAAASNSKVISVVDYVVQLLHKDRGEMDAPKLAKLAMTHPEAQHELKMAGGLERFCAKHNSRLRFLNLNGVLKIGLCPVVDTLVGLVTKHGGKMAGSAACSQLYALHPRAQEEIKMANGLKGFCALHLDRLCFVPEESGSGPGTVLLARAPSEGYQAQQSMYPSFNPGYSAQHPGYPLPPHSGGALSGSRVQAPPSHPAAAAASAGSEPAGDDRSVLEFLLLLLHGQGGAMGSERLPVLYRLHPGARAAIERAGGVERFCAVHSDRIRFRRDRGQGTIVLAEQMQASEPPSTSPAIPQSVTDASRGQPAALRYLQANTTASWSGVGGAESSAAASKLAGQAQSQLSAAPHSARTHQTSSVGHPNSQMANAPRLQGFGPPSAASAFTSSTTQQSHAPNQPATASRIITGKLTSLLPTYGFMESSPGVSDVYIPLMLIDHPEELKEGGSLRVRAVEHAQGRCRFKCVEVLEVMHTPVRPQPQQANPHLIHTTASVASDTIALPALLPFVSQSVGARTAADQPSTTTPPAAVAQNEVDLTGTLVSILPLGSLMESSPGVKDVLVPRELVDAHDPPLKVGDSLLVRAIPRMEGPNRFRVTEIVAAEPSEPPVAMSAVVSTLSTEKMVESAPTLEPPAQRGVSVESNIDCDPLQVLDLFGKLVRMLPNGSFMESSPGVTDVFVPADLVDNQDPSLNIGDTLLVRAVKHVVGSNNYRVTQIVEVEPWDGLTKLSGKVVRVLPTCAFMESSPGISDVFIPEDFIQALQVGDMLSVLGEEHGMGTTKYRCVEIISMTKGGVTQMTEGKALTGKLVNLLPNCAFMESSPGISDVYIPLAVIDRHPEKLREGDTLKVRAVDNDHPKNKFKCLQIVQVTRADQEHSLSDDNDGATPLTNRAAGAKEPLSSAVQSQERDHQVDLTGTLVSILPLGSLMESSPGVKDVLVPRELVDAHDPPLKVGDSLLVRAIPRVEGPNRFRVTEIVAAEPSKPPMTISTVISTLPKQVAAAHGLRRLTGKVVTVLPTCAFMESSPGNSNVFIPECFVQALQVGDMLSVMAEDRACGATKYHCVEVISATKRPGISEQENDTVGPAGASPDSSTPFPKPSAVQPTRMTSSDLKQLKGRLVTLLPTCAFMESSPGISDVYIPQPVIDGHPEKLREGDTLSVYAVDNNHPKNKFKCLEIVEIVRSDHFQLEEEAKLPFNADATIATTVKPAAVQAGEWNDPPVLEAVIRLVVEHNGVMAGRKVNLLYEQCPQSRAELQAAGGLKGFCQLHSSRIEFIPDAFAGSVVLRGRRRGQQPQTSPPTGNKAKPAGNRFLLLDKEEQGLEAGATSSSSDDDDEGSVHSDVQRSGAEATTQGPSKVSKPVVDEDPIDAFRREAGDSPQAPDWLWDSMSALLCPAAPRETVLTLLRGLMLSEPRVAELNHPSVKALFNSLARLEHFVIAAEGAAVLAARRGGTGERQENPSSDPLFLALERKNVGQHAALILAAAKAVESLREREVEAELSELDAERFAKIERSIPMAASATLSFFLGRGKLELDMIPLRGNDLRIMLAGLASAKPATLWLPLFPCVGTDTSHVPCTLRVECSGIIVNTPGARVFCPACHGAIEFSDPEDRMALEEAAVSYVGQIVIGNVQDAFRQFLRFVQAQNDVELAPCLAVPDKVTTDWLRDSWAAMLRLFPLVELVLLSDDSAAARGEAGRLFRVLFKAVMSLFNRSKGAAEPMKIAMTLLVNFVKRVVDVPEFTVDQRIQAAVTTARAIKPLISSKLRAGDRSYSAGFIIGKSGPLETAVRSCRPGVVAALLDWIPEGCNVLNSSEGAWPLHCICALQTSPPVRKHSVQLSQVVKDIWRGRSEPKEHIRMGGFTWTVSVYICPHAGTMAALEARIFLVEASALERESGVNTEIALGVNHFGTVLEARAEFSRECPSHSFWLPLLGPQVNTALDIQLSACSPFLVNPGGKSLRSSSEWNADKEEVIRLLVQHKADVNLKDEDGRLPWSLAVEHNLPEHLARLVMPTQLEQVLNSAAAAKDPVVMAELLPLAKELPLEQEQDLNVAGFIGRRTKDDSAVLPLVLELLKRDLSPSSLISALETSVRHKDWALTFKLLHRISNCKAEVAPPSLPLHEVVAAGQNDILIVLLDLGTDPHSRQESTGESVLHVACRLGNLAAAQAFLERGCSLHTKDHNGNYPLHAAAQSSGAMVELLLDANADTAVTNKWKQRPIDVAKSKEVRRAFDTQSRSRKPAQPPTSKMSPPPPENQDSQATRAPAAPSRERVYPSKAHTAAETGEAAPAPEAVVTHEQRVAAAKELIGKLCSMPTEDGGGEVVPDHDDDVSVHGGQNKPSEGQESERSVPGTVQHSKKESIKDCEGNSPSLMVHSDPNSKVKDDDNAELEVVGENSEAAILSAHGSEWDLRCTREFKELLFSPEMCSNTSLMRPMLKNLQRLARGEQGRGLMKLLKGTPKSLRIFESPCKTFNDGGRMLWQYAVDYSPRIKGFTETIRLWKLALSHDEVPKAIENIVEAHKRGRTSTVTRTLKASFSETCLRDGRRFPRTYQTVDGVDEQQVRALLAAEQMQFEQLVEEMEDDGDHQADMLVYTPPAVAAANSYNVLKFYALNGEVLNLASEMSKGGKDSVHQGSPEFPFIPDQKEDSIISIAKGKEAASVLLIGRSGTGKTSIALGKMWKQYETWHATFQPQTAADEESLPRYHQVFVTANKVLRDQVRKSFEGMRSGMLGVTSAEDASDYPPSLGEVQEQAFPLFLTQSEWLTMVDGTLSEPFFPRNADGSLKEKVESGFHEERGMLDSLPDFEDSWLSDGSDDDDGWDLESRGVAPSEVGDVLNAAQGKRIEVDSRTFHAVVWPKIAARKREEIKQMSASALFQEIHSYIKGSYLALDRPSGRLSREDYLRLPAKMAPNFKGLSTAESVEDLPGDRRGNRDLVYDLFEVYEEEKTKMDGYDISDVIHHIWARLQSEGYNGPNIDSIFVDETQDFTQAELRLFIRICRDKNDMFFSGDTCQTIASGVGFRFEDLRSLFKEEQDAQMQSGVQLPSELKISVPSVSVLCLNYRTHNGILTCAAGIVDLLEAFFPGTIDFLPRESGLFPGPKPILLQDTKMDDAALLIVGSDKNTSQIEFGAHQVILVRSQEAKQYLPREFDSCLAMTVLESKGLEFDDVFLWNFMSDSRAVKEWRVVLSFLSEQDDATLQDLEQQRSAIKDSEHSGMLRPLEFSEHAHLLLCEELKQLYTAITRARVRVIIYEEDEVKRAPMFYYLQRKQLVDVLSYFKADAHMPLTVKTSSQEWYNQGVNLKNNHMLRLAAMCFAKAGDAELENEVMGQFFAEDAAADADNSSRRDKFFKAGEHFLKAGRRSALHAAQCFASAKELRLAAELYVLCGGGHVGRGIRCLMKVGDTEKAVELLLQHGRVKAALQLLKREAKAEAALDVLDSHPDFEPPPELQEQEFVKMALVKFPARATATEQGVEKFLTLARRLPPELELDHLRRRGLREALVARLKQLGMTVQAAAELEKDGNLREGAELLEALSEPDDEALRLCSELYTALYLEPSTEPREAGELFDKIVEMSQRFISFSKPAGRDDDVEAQRNRLRLLQYERAAKTSDLAQKQARLAEQTASSDNPAASLLETTLVRSEWIKAVANSTTYDCMSQVFPWLADLATVSSGFDELLRVMTLVQQSDSSNIPWQSYFPSERLFGFKRQRGMCTIRKVAKTLLFRVLEITDMGQDSEAPIFDASGSEIFNATAQFQPALTYFLSCKRLDVLQNASDHIEQACAAVERNEETDHEMLLRWTLVQMWCVNAQSQAEEWHWKSSKLFLPPESHLRQSFSPKLLGQAHRSKRQRTVLAKLVAHLLSRASKGMAVRIKDVVAAVPLSLSEVRKELQAHASSLLNEWSTRSVSERSARMLSTALCILYSCGLDIRRDLGKIATQMADGRGWHPPLVQSGIADLVGSTRQQRDGLPLTSSMSSAKYIGIHVDRDPPIDAWPLLETALAEACVALNLANPTRGTPSGSAKTYLPLSIASRVRRDRRGDSTDPKELLLHLFDSTSRVLRRHVEGTLDASLNVTNARTAAVLQAVLLNFVLACGQPDSRWSSVGGQLLSQQVKQIPLEVLIALHWLPDDAAAIAQSGQCFAVSPNYLELCLLSLDDSLVAVHGDSKVQRVFNLSETDFTQVQQDFEAVARNSTAENQQQVPDAVVVSCLTASWDTVNAENQLPAEQPQLAQEGEAEEMGGMGLEEEEFAVATLCKYVRRILDRRQYCEWVGAEMEAATAKESDGAEVRDPFQRRMRYVHHFEAPIESDGGHFMAIFNGGVALFDSSSPDYLDLKASFLEFHSVYVSTVAPALIQADSIMLALREVTLKGVLVPVYAQDMHAAFAELTSATVHVLSTLDDIDLACAWKEELRTDASRLAIETSALVGVLPRVEAFLQHLQASDPSELFLPPDALGPPLPPPSMAPSQQFPVFAPMMTMPLPMPAMPQDLPVPHTRFHPDAPEWFPDQGRSSPLEWDLLDSGETETTQTQSTPPSPEKQGGNSAGDAVGRPEDGTSDGRQRWLEGLAAGSRCEVKYFKDGRVYPAKVLHKTKKGWMVEFEGYEGDKTGQQDTPLSRISPPRSVDDQDDADELGWSVVQSRGAQRRPAVRRHGGRRSRRSKAKDSKGQGEAGAAQGSAEGAKADVQGNSRSRKSTRGHSDAK